MYRRIYRRQTRTMNDFDSNRRMYFDFQNLWIRIQLYLYLSRSRYIVSI